MHNLTEADLNFFESVLGRVETPFTFGDILELVGEEWDDVGILAGLDVLVKEGLLQKVSNPIPAYTRAIELDPGILHSSLAFLRATGGGK